MHKLLLLSFVFLFSASCQKEGPDSEKMLDEFGLTKAQRSIYQTLCFPLDSEAEFEFIENKNFKDEDAVIRFERNIYPHDTIELFLIKLDSAPTSTYQINCPVDKKYEKDSLRVKVTGSTYTTRSLQRSNVVSCFNYGFISLSEIKSL